MRNKKLIGKFHYNKSGIGYVILDWEDGTQRAVSILTTARDGVFDGDTVEVVCPNDYDSRGRRFGGKILRVVSRKQDFVDGTLFSDSDGKEYLQPISYIPFRVPLKNSSFGMFPVGDLVRASICPARAVSAIRVAPEHSFGKADTYESALAALMYGSCFGTSFSPDAVLQTKELVRDSDGHQDFADRRTFDAGLFAPVNDRGSGVSDVAFGVDCASSVSTTVYIHLIDIDYFVPTGSPLDKDAANRFCTIRGVTSSKYSMLPLTLTGSALNIASPGVHPALTLRAEFSREGRVVSLSVEESCVSNAVPLRMSEIEEYLVGKSGFTAATYGRELKRLSELADRLLKTRVEAGGTAPLPRYVHYYDNSMTEDTIDKESDIGFIFDEILMAAGQALGKLYTANGADGLYSSTSLPVASPDVDIPLYYRPLAAFCDIYSSRRLSEAAANSRGTTSADAISCCVNFLIPPATFSLTPADNRVLGLQHYCPIAHPTSSYDAVVQQRAMKAMIHGEKFAGCDAEELSHRNSTALTLERELTLLSACRYYSQLSLVPVTVVSTSPALTVRTAGGILGELVLNVSVQDTFQEGASVRARVKSVSYQKRQIVFTL